MWFRIHTINVICPWMYCRQLLPPPLQNRKYTEGSCGPAQFSEAERDKTLSGRTKNEQLNAKLGKVKVKQASPPSSDLSSRPLSKKYAPSPPQSSRSLRSLGSPAKVRDTLSSARSFDGPSENETEKEQELWVKKPSKTVTEKEIVR